MSVQSSGTTEYEDFQRCFWWEHILFFIITAFYYYFSESTPDHKFILLSCINSKNIKYLQEIIS